MTLSLLLDELNTIAPAFVDAAVRGAVVLLAALVLTTLMRRRSAAARHLVWVGAIAIQLLLPVFAVWGPKWDVAIPHAVAAVSPVTIPDQAVVATTPSIVINEERSAPTTRVEVPPAPASTPAPVITGRQLLLAIWVTGGLFILARLAAGTAIVARLARRGNRVDDGNWLSLAQRLSASLQIDRPLTLMRGTKLGVPVTWGIVYPVVLLPDDADNWPEERRRFVLVHEMAHVKRLDALTQLAGQFALALFWFNPLVWIANRRMQLEREHACDDYVIRHGTTPSTYAEELLSMVRSLGTSDRSAQPAFAALAMARRSEFEGRMLSILDPVLDRHPLSKARTLASAAAALVLVVPLAALHPYQRAMTPPAVQAPVTTATKKTAEPELPESFKINILPSGPVLDTAALARKLVKPVSELSDKLSTLAESAQAVANRGAVVVREPTCDNIRLGGSGGGTSTHIHADDDPSGSQIIDFTKYNAERCQTAVMVGKLKFSEREDDIIDMPFGAHANFRVKTTTEDRELMVSRTQDGAINHVYRYNGQIASYDDGARRWFASYLPTVLMEAGMNVEPRVARWKQEGGVELALKRIEAMSGSSAKRSHYDALMHDGTLSAEALGQVVASAATHLSSSSDMRAILMKAAPTARLSRQNVSAVERALAAMASSGDKAAVLQAYGQTDDRDMLLSVMRSAQSVASSGDRSRLLQVLVVRYLTKNDRALEDAWFGVLERLPSSGDMRNVLMAAVPYGVKSVPVGRQLIATARKISSSGDQAAVLIGVVSTGVVTTKELRDAFFDAAAAVPSDSDKARVLQVAAGILRQ